MKTEWRRTSGINKLANANTPARHSGRRGRAAMELQLRRLPRGSCRLWPGSGALAIVGGDQRGREELVSLECVAGYSGTD